MYQLDFSVSKRCSVLCTGRYTTKNEIYDEEHCVGFSITFNLNTNYPTKLKDVSCGISRCILKVIDFECFYESLIIRDQRRGTGCAGNIYFEFIQLFVVTVKKKILYTHSILIIVSAPPVVVLHFFYNHHLNNPELASNLFIKVHMISKHNDCIFMLCGVFFRIMTYIKQV